MTFSKDDTLAIKGISILFMLTHHNFRVTTLFKDQIVNFAPFTQDFVVDIALFFKICVSLFVFVSSYGLALSLKNTIGKHEVKVGFQFEKWLTTRLISVLSGYWFVFILSSIVCQFIDQRTTDIYFNKNLTTGVMSMVVDFLGLGKLFGIKQLNGTWWYMSAAIMIIVFVPIIYFAFKKFGYILTLVLCIGLPRVLKLEHTGTDFKSYLFLVIMGMIIAEYNILGRLKEFKIVKNFYINKVIKFVVLSILICISYKAYLQLPMKQFWEIKLGIIPILVIYFSYEFITELPILGTILKFIGKHSMNIFLVHTFIRAYYLKDFTYSFQHFILIIAVLLLISIAISIVIEYFKKILRYQKMIDRIKKFCIGKLELLYNT
ncbi:acyltransferase family protein [Anaerosacchariphilus polymeriproducens]|uniref:Acyltransferase 3 domain-containing protein n=1 Tax=Anaerosacchariphilus polymeriproducens TaxID=1812858 RepID=A0A371ARB6_9FIRM|nr:acyltransferase family protein [Anaerosacchariphilus polymeriproducens]RDU22126.1 hypothetical protein DWV06_16485 [Anaerosacchariphilus polymeriproducens]